MPTHQLPSRCARRTCSTASTEQPVRIPLSSPPSALSNSHTTINTYMIRLRRAHTHPVAIIHQRTWRSGC